MSKHKMNSGMSRRNFLRVAGAGAAGAALAGPAGFLIGRGGGMKDNFVVLERGDVHYPGLTPYDTFLEGGKIAYFRKDRWGDNIIDLVVRNIGEAGNTPGIVLKTHRIEFPYGAPRRSIGPIIFPDEDMALFRRPEGVSKHWAIEEVPYLIDLKNGSYKPLLPLEDIAQFSDKGLAIEGLAFLSSEEIAFSVVPDHTITGLTGSIDDGSIGIYITNYQKGSTRKISSARASNIALTGKDTLLYYMDPNLDISSRAGKPNKTDIFKIEGAAKIDEAAKQEKLVLQLPLDTWRTNIAFPNGPICTSGTSRFAYVSGDGPWLDWSYAGSNSSDIRANRLSSNLTLRKVSDGKADVLHSCPAEFKVKNNPPWARFSTAEKADDYLTAFHPLCRHVAYCGYPTSHYVPHWNQHGDTIAFDVTTGYGRKKVLLYSARDKKVTELEIPRGFELDSFCLLPSQLIVTGKDSGGYSGKGFGKGTLVRINLQD